MLRAGGALPAADQEVAFVPWKVLNPGDEPARGDIILYWLPASRDDMRHSPLLTSRPLAIYASQCVGMQVIRPDDVVMIERLGATGKLPAAVLANSSGEILERIENDHGALRIAEVERITRELLTKLDAETDQVLDAASSKASSGDRDGAAGLYQKVIDRKCLFPRKAREAEKALRRLGAR